MGITGAPFGPIATKLCRATPPWRALARGKGPRVPGGWGVGNKCKHVSLGHFVFFLFFFRFSEISNGHNWGAILSNLDETLSHDTSVIWSIFWGLEAGAWGLGRWEKVENWFIFGPFVVRLFFFRCFFFAFSNENTKSVKFARIGFILIQNESPHRVLGSPGIFGKFFK